MKTRFDLESEIAAAYSTVEDLDLVLKVFETLDEDSLLNILIGIKELHERRMQVLSNTFESLIHSGDIK